MIALENILEIANIIEVRVSNDFMWLSMDDNKASGPFNVVEVQPCVE